jgi:AraC-like DNA-binding protein
MSNMTPGPRVVEAEPPVPELPELAGIALDTVRRAGAARLDAHVHETMELCYLERGRVWSWVGNELYEVGGGNVYVTWPHELHGPLHGAINPCRRYVLCVPLWPGGRRGGRTFLGLPAGEAEALVAALESLPRRHFGVAPPAGRRWRLLLENAVPGAGPHRLSRLRATLLELLLDVVEAAGAGAPPERSPLVREAVSCMEANLARPLPAAELAARLGWSVSHVQHRFRAELGMPPAEWYLRRRVIEACRLLEQTDEPVTRIGLELGFSSSQYFATAFARVIGSSPSGFRNAIRTSSSSPANNGARPTS